MPPLPPRDAPDWETLARVRAGEATPDEAAMVAAWAAAHPEDARLLDAMDGAIDATLVADAPSTAMAGMAVDTEAALRAVRARMAEADALAAGRVTSDPASVRPIDAPARFAARRAPRAVRRGRWLAAGLAAAAAIVVVALGVQRGGTDANARGMTVATVVGVQDTIRLPDGTVAVLAPESRLAIGPAFGASARDVTLDGMAHFTVVHDDARPFTVHAGGAAVRDIGTAFVVRVDGVQGGERVTVEVTDGQVMLRGGAAGADSVLLARGDRGVLAPGGTLTAARGAVTAGATAWTAGRLVYADTPIELVRADLRRWYGVNLLVADSALAGARVTATFDREPVERVLRLLALALGASVTRQGDLVVLRGSGAAP